MYWLLLHDRRSLQRLLYATVRHCRSYVDHVSQTGYKTSSWIITLYIPRWSKQHDTYWAFTRYDRRTDRPVRLVCPAGRSDDRSCKRFVRPVGQTVGCLISSDCRSDCRSVWTLRPTGRTDRPVGRPITLQRRRYLLLTS